MTCIIRFVTSFLAVVTLTCRDSNADAPLLVELVGADIGACIEINGLREQIDAIPKSNWFRRSAELPFVKSWQEGQEYAKLQAGKVALEGLIGMPLDRFTSELFGDSVLMVITPNSNGNPDTILLSRAERDDSWDRVLRLWDLLEAHDVQTMSAYGRSFQRRRKVIDGRKVGPDLFTTKVGRTLAISESEAQIRNVLARSNADTPTSIPPSLGSSSLYKSATAALPQGCSIRAIINPRAWDTTFQKASPADAWVSGIWNKLEWLSAGIELRDGVVFHAVVHHETEGIPEVWQRVVQASQVKGDFAKRLPANSLIASEFHLDPKLLNWISTLDQSERSQRDWRLFAIGARGILGRDLFEEVLPHFQSVLGAAVVPSITLSERSGPVDAVFAWEISNPEKDSANTDQTTFRESLDSGMTALLNFAAVSHNSHNPESPAIIRRKLGSESVIRWLDGLTPYRPAFGVLEKHLLLATNPQLITSFPKTQAPTKAESLDATLLFNSVRSRHFADRPQWLFLNASLARQFVHDNREPLSRQLAYWRKIETTNAGQHLDRLTELLTPFDVGFAAVKLAASEVSFTAGLVTPAWQADK